MTVSRFFELLLVVLIVAILIGMLFPNVVIVADGRSELKIKFDFDVQNQDDVWWRYAGTNGDAELSYHEPEFVVIQMGQNGSGEPLVFEMPQGRGARTLDANPQYAIVNEALHEVRD